MLRYDLHAHSTASDGTNTPTALLAKVAAAGIDVFALTDHDTVAGITEARTAADAHGVKLINGVEISCTHTLAGGYGKHKEIEKIIHVVALDFKDIAKLDAALQALQDSRHQRGEQMLRKLAELLATDATPTDALFAILWDKVLAMVDNNPRAIGRAHIGQVLYELGYVNSVQSAFDKYLADNKPAYVPIQTISMAETIVLIHDCGGIAVLAHPSRYKLSSTRTQRLISDFSQMGGDACELPNNEPQSLIAMVRRCITKHGLMVSVGSDFHGSNMPWRKLGSTARTQDGDVGVWEKFTINQ